MENGRLQYEKDWRKAFDKAKKAGNIVSFRDIEAQLNEAILMFGDKKEDTGNIVLIHSFEEYYGFQANMILN